ncbi:5'-nucleotidase, lipoprotein e(P4) family [Glutamicibacter sp. TV12E]|uniref:5'-nucleotidase, lipoprotein e(P4) family n=1 Tax=Glutamicibacter sp. TV12E TaxID=3446362 RepID=UPI004034683D
MRKIIAIAAALAVGSGGGYAAAAAQAPAAAETSGTCAVSQYAMALRWQQQSAEAQALQGQTYAMATVNLEQKVKEARAKSNSGKGKSAPKGQDLAIITDLDETVIDNTALLARDMEQCHDYTTWDTWGSWETEGHPSLINGAKEFLDRADQLGVDIFYISDRGAENLDATLDSLKQLGLPQASKEQVLLLGPPKQERRAEVQSGHKVLMQLGDTLHDFDEDFAGTPLEQQRGLVEQNSRKFGDEWIILPNPTYGSWSTATLDAWEADPEVWD